MFPCVSNHSPDRHITVHAVYFKIILLFVAFCSFSKRLVIISLLIGKLYNFTHFSCDISISDCERKEGSQSTQEITHIACKCL